jgi:hypothetical protein
MEWELTKLQEACEQYEEGLIIEALRELKELDTTP